MYACVVCWILLSLFRNNLISDYLLTMEGLWNLLSPKLKGPDFVQMWESFAREQNPFRIVLLEQTLRRKDNVKDMFKLIWDMESVHRIFVPFCGQRKCVNLTREWREIGNTNFRCGRYDLALELYNKCVVLAPHPELKVHVESDHDNTKSDSLNCEMRCEPKCTRDELEKYKDLSFAYANRSAVLLVLKKYDSCLVDIDLALEYGYPANMRHKLEERREKCKKAKVQASGIKANPNIVLNKKVPPCLKECNPNIPAFSSALKVAFSNSKGRHVVATRDISPGRLYLFFHSLDMGNCLDNFKCRLEFA